MAIIKFVNSKPTLKKIINYVTKESKTYDNLISGKDCIPQNAYEEMIATKKLFNKEDGRQHIHLVQSFSIKDNIDYTKAHELGKKLAEYFKDYQVLIVTHTDREHIHNHLVINSVNFNNGKKFNQSKKEMQKLKEYSDQLCSENGLSITAKNSQIKDIGINEYKVALKGESWKFRLTNAIDNSMNNSLSKTEFIIQMNKLGYQVKWSVTRKNITYTTPEGMKCRDYKLHEEKYLKERMEEYYAELEGNESNNLSREGKDTKMSIGNGTYNDNGLYNGENKQVTKSNGYNETRGNKQSKYNKNGQLNRYDNTKNNTEYKRKSNDSDGQVETGDNDKNEDNLFSTRNIIYSNNNNFDKYIDKIIKKEELSKQAKIDYAIKKRNSSSIEWE